MLTLQEIQNRLLTLNTILNTHQHKRLKCRNSRVLIDTTTAKAILLIFNAIKNDATKEKFMSLDWDKMANFAWQKCNFKMVGA